MTIGERIDNTLADGLVAAGRGIRFGLTIAAKIGDRLLGGSPFNEREAQRFLTMGGSERLDRAEEANEVLEPFWADGGPNEWLSDSPVARSISGITCPMCGTYTERDTKGLFNCPGCSVLLVVTTSSNNESSAPVAHSPEPVAAESPEVADPPSEATSGHPIDNGPAYRIGAPSDPNADFHLCKTWDGACHCLETPDSHGEQPASVGVTGPGAGEVAPGRAEHPLYREVQDQCNAALVAEVLGDHHYFRGDAKTASVCLCGVDLLNVAAWQRHVAPLVLAALQQ